MNLGSCLLSSQVIYVLRNWALSHCVEDVILHIFMMVPTDSSLPGSEITTERSLWIGLLGVSELVG